MTFKDYLKEKNIVINEQLSKDEEKDVIEAAHNIAKEIHGKKYDKATTEKLAKDTIKKHKDKNIDAIIEIITNSLQK